MVAIDRARARAILHRSCGRQQYPRQRRLQNTRRVTAARPSSYLLTRSLCCFFYLFVASSRSHSTATAPLFLLLLLLGTLGAWTTRLLQKRAPTHHHPPSMSAEAAENSRDPPDEASISLFGPLFVENRFVECSEVNREIRKLKGKSAWISSWGWPFAPSDSTCSHH